MRRMAGLGAGVLVVAAVLAAPTPAPATGAPALVEHCQSLQKHGHNFEARACYQALVAESDHYLRAEGFWGLAQYTEANEEFRAAVAQAPANPLYKVRWGRMLHERFNDQDAMDLFKEALAKDPNNAQAYFGLAEVSAGGFSDGAVEFARKALQLNPQLTAAHELLASLALEDSQPDQAATEADAALKSSPEALDALAVHASIELLADRSPDPWIGKITAVNPSYGEG
jgi:cellulose synthase operon protein C